MPIVENLFILISGFALLVLSGDKLVDTSVKIARRLKVPSSVIAVTIIAAGTSAPELVTSFIAGFKGSSDIAIGNVIGSNTFNILAVAGLSLIFQPFGRVSGTFMSWLILIAGSLLFFLSIQDFQISPSEAAVFLTGLLCFLLYSFFSVRDDEDSLEYLENQSFKRTLFFFFLSIGGLVAGAELALKGGVNLGQLAGLSDRIIAITIISVGTGLPELATSIAAALKGHSDMAIANVIGSNIFNTLAIPGITASFFPLMVDQQFLNFDFYMMAAATAGIATIYFFKNHRIRRLLGVVMVGVYIAYTYSLVIQ